MDVPLRARRSRGGGLTQAPQPVELRHGAVSAAESALIAVSATAPANTLATSTAALVAAVGLSAPGALLFCAVPMLGISLAYYYLNAWRSDAGAAYAWVGRSLSPTLGFFAGWALVMAGLLFMVTGSLPVASATLDVVAPKLVNSVAAVTAVGFLWFVAVLGIVLLGIKATANFQKAVTIFQIVGLLAIAAGAIAQGIAHPANAPSATWWLPTSGGGFHAFVGGALVAIFFFWGWDISANLTEETVDRNRAPGIAGIAGLAIILSLFVITLFATQLALSQQAIAAANSNLLVALADVALPRPWNGIAVAVVIVSTIGSLETALLQGSRTLFAMGRDRVLDERLAHLNARFLTPWNATLAIAVVAVALFVLAATSPSVNALLSATIDAIGVQIAFYYGLSGFACARYYARANRGLPAMFWLRGVWPVAAALFVVAIAALQLAQAGAAAATVIVGLLAIGALPMIYYRRALRSVYYTEPMERAG